MVTHRLISAFGLLVMIAIAWGLSENRKAISWRLVAWGLFLQFGVGLIVLKTPLKELLFPKAQAAVQVLTDATVKGASFVFGNLPTNGEIGAFFAFQVLPVIVFVSAISAMLHHLHVIQTIVGGIAWVMRRTLKTSGAETFCAALMIFLGIEATTAVRGYVKKMTRSELCVIMTTYMATIAGSVMVLYSTFGAEAGHLLTASFMSAPAAILLAKMFVPETATPETAGNVRVSAPVESHNAVDAVAQGTTQGLHMALNVGATVLVFVGLVYLLDLFFQSITGLGFVQTMSYLFIPFAWLLGVPTKDVPAIAELLGTKTVLNEMFAYLDLQQMINDGSISKRSITIATYALCGFANPGSVGITIAGLDALAPERRGDIAKLSMKALIGGALASLMTACIAGIIVYE